VKAAARAAGLGLCLLNACAADVVSVGEWVDDAKPDPPFDASPDPTLDATPGPTLDATPDPPLDAAPKPPLEPAGPYVEAEGGELSGGFVIEEDARGSGGKVLTAVERANPRDLPGDARARYLLDVLADGDYVLWGRIHGQDANHNRFWFQVDGGTWYLWRMSTGDSWFWDDLHHDTSYKRPVIFTLTRGVHELLLANATEGVQLDRLYFTAAGDKPPGNDTACRPPHSVELSGNCVPSCGTLNGTSCGPLSCEGRPLLEAYDCDVCCQL